MEIAIALILGFAFRCGVRDWVSQRRRSKGVLYVGDRDLGPRAIQFKRMWNLANYCLTARLEAKAKRLAEVSS
jgi:hypothetical protein